MLWVLLVLAVPISCSRTVAWDQARREAHFTDEVSMATRPLIYYCRSRNMEDFSCYWHPLDNISEADDVSYVLTYNKDKGPVQECPDYFSSGPHSCHFDSRHTTIWKIYCMNVTAITLLGNYSSPQHCLDVAEIVETEAPVNLTYDLYDAGGDEMGHNTLLSWTYPKPSDLQYGWITLVYELQYRRVNEPHNWKVKSSLREPHVELLGLPVGEYVVKVRCRSHNYGRWSQWSQDLHMTIPARPPTGKLLALVLVTGVSVVALVGFTLGLVQQSKRIKEYFLPPIPKPRIIGIDPLLLKKGHLDEINRHFLSFHGYSPPSYSYGDDIWDQVSADDHLYLTSPPASETENPSHCREKTNQEPHEEEKDALIIPCDASPVNHGSYVTANPTPSQTDFILAIPGSDYSVMGKPGVSNQEDIPDQSQLKANAASDFYTCVQLMHDTGEVHLVPAYCGAFPNWDEKTKQKEEFEARKIQDGGEREGKEEVREARPVSDAVQ